MRSPECPAWEYDNHPRRADVLKRQVSTVVSNLMRSRFDTLQAAVDTRPIHRTLFSELTPSGCDYYAGHYRGEHYLCLRHYEVQIASDATVGYEAASSVALAMQETERLIRAGIAVLDVNRKIPEAHLPRGQKVLQAVVFACRIFELFLRIHPYANGNGHAARFLIWALLVRYGYFPRRWPIEPRPPDPPYTSLITEYRRGNHEPLEEFVLKTIA